MATLPHGHADPRCSGGRSVTIPVMVRCGPSLAHGWISGGVGGVSAGATAIAGVRTVATLACLLRGWVVVHGCRLLAPARYVAGSPRRCLRARSPFGSKTGRAAATDDDGAAFTVRSPAAVARALGGQLAASLRSPRRAVRSRRGARSAQRPIGRRPRAGTAGCRPPPPSRALASARNA